MCFFFFCRLEKLPNINAEMNKKFLKFVSQCLVSEKEFFYECRSTVRMSCIIIFQCIFSISRMKKWSKWNLVKYCRHHELICVLKMAKLPIGMENKCKTMFSAQSEKNSINIKTLPKWISMETRAYTKDVLMAY